MGNTPKYVHLSAFYAYTVSTVLKPNQVNAYKKTGKRLQRIVQSRVWSSTPLLPLVIHVLSTKLTVGWANKIAEYHGKAIPSVSELAGRCTSKECNPVSKIPI